MVQVVEEQAGPRIRPSIGLTVSVVSISTAAILIRLTSAEPLAVAAYRLSFSTLILLPLVFVRGADSIRCLSRRDLGYLLLVGLSLAVHFGLWVTSLYHTTVAASVLLVTTSPIFVTLLGWALFGEHVGRKVVLGIGLAMSGVVVVILPAELSGDLPGLLMAVGGAVAVSVYLIGGRRLRQRLSLVPYVFCVYATASIILVLSCLASGVELINLQARDFMLFIALGIVPSHLGHTLYNYLLKYLDARVIAVSTLGEPILSSMLAVIILAETPQPTVFLGAPLVLLGIYVTMTGTDRARSA